MRIDEIKLTGQWHIVTYEEAYNGKLGMLFFEYTKDKTNGFEFYGILSHDAQNQFSYFIGIRDDCGEVVIPSGDYYQKPRPTLAYETYENLAKENLNLLNLFNSSHQYNQIPLKIEKYQLNHDTLELIEILIPLMIV